MVPVFENTIGEVGSICNYLLPSQHLSFFYTKDSVLLLNIKKTY